MDSQGDSSLSIEFECNENIQFCGYTRLIVTRGLLSQILFCFIFTLFSAPHSICSFQTGKLRLVFVFTIHKKSPADVGSCVHGTEEFVCWNSSGDTLRCGGGLGLATHRGVECCADYHLNHPLPSPPFVAMYQSVISVTVARPRGNLNVHTLRWPALLPLLRSGPRGDCYYSPITFCQNIIVFQGLWLR